jgi:hypothetical protein
LRAQANRLSDKLFLQEVAERMNCSQSRIKLDDCGDWNILGKDGHLYTDGLGVLYLFYKAETAWKWRNFKKRFSFMEEYVDGDEEGILALYRLPTEREGESLRKALKLKISYIPTNAIENVRNLTSESPTAGGK